MNLICKVLVVLLHFVFLFSGANIYSDARPSWIVLAADGTPIINGERTILYGTYRFDSDKADWENEITELAGMGFNLIHSYRFETRYGTDIRKYVNDAKEFLMLAAQHKMGVFLGLPRELVSKTPLDLDGIKLIVHTLKSEPALWFWYLYDEPESKMEKNLTSLYTLLKKIDYFHPVIIAHNSAHLLKAAKKYSDLLWADKYPIPASLWYVKEFVKDVKNCSNPFVWIVSQAHAINQIHHAREWKYNTTTTAKALTFGPNTHRPNPKEIRAQFHHAVSCNSPGSIYYWYPSGFYDLKTAAPEVWQSFRTLGAEINELSPILISRESVPKISLYVNNTKSNYTNLARNPNDNNLKIRIDVIVASWRKWDISNKFNLRYWVRKKEGTLYTGIVNASLHSNLVITIHLPFAFKRLYQYPQKKLIIDRTNKENIITHFDTTDVIIRNSSAIPEDDFIHKADSITFLLDENDTVVWGFDEE